MLQNGSSFYSDLTQLVSAKELSTLLKVSNALASTLELGEVLQITIASVPDLLGIETGAIYVLNDEELYLGATTPPLPPQFPGELRTARVKDHPHICQAIDTKAPVYLHDARKARLTPAEILIVESRNLISLLYFPLLLKENAIGAFIVGTTQKPRRFTDIEMDICHILAAQASLAITNARLYQESRKAMADITRAYDATLSGWSRVLDLRDQITEEHTSRVTELTIALARRMGVPGCEFEHIRRGALLHDIGKIGIPDAILQKPGVLTADEQAIMRSHPVLAYELLSDIDYLVPALDIPFCHHEKWDGTGYPRGLAGEAIPLAARIFAVVDVYDALTSDRPYRRAWEQEKALQYLREQAGRHFDPAAVEAFLEVFGGD